MPRRRRRSRRSQPDLGVIVAYGGLVREPLLSTPAHGWINLHFSLLPRWRGAAPVQHALIAGDRGDRRVGVPARRRARRGRRLRGARVPGARRRDRRATCWPRSPVDGAELLREVVDAIAAGTAVAVAADRGADPRPEARRRRRPHPLGRAARRRAGADPRSHPRAGRAHDGRRRPRQGARRARGIRGRAARSSRACSPAHGRDVIVGTATDPVVARPRAARRQGADGRRRLVARSPRHAAPARAGLMSAAKHVAPGRLRDDPRGQRVRRVREPPAARRRSRAPASTPRMPRWRPS